MCGFVLDFDCGCLFDCFGLGLLLAAVCMYAWFMCFAWVCRICCDFTLVLLVCNGACWFGLACRFLVVYLLVVLLVIAGAVGVVFCVLVCGCCWLYRLALMMTCLRRLVIAACGFRCG